MHIHRIPVLRDNYIFVLHDPIRAIAAVVDPAEAAPVLDLIRSLSATLVAIFNTHHHHDHIGGNRDLLRHFPEAIVYGGEADRGRIPGQTVFLQGGDRVTFGEDTADVLFVPGHTRAHIAYYFPPRQIGNMGDLFCGDTLFSGGCGRLFEGTPTQMVTSLEQIRHLPDATRVWCAHEYTLNNLKFALTVDRANEALHRRFAAVEALRRCDEPTIPTTLAIEKQTNPFLRWDNPQIQQYLGIHDNIRSFGKLRGMKDLF